MGHRSPEYRAVDVDRGLRPVVDVCLISGKLTVGEVDKAVSRNAGEQYGGAVFGKNVSEEGVISPLAR